MGKFITWIRGHLALVIICTCAFIFRVIFLAEYSKTPFFSHLFLDSAYYNHMAREIIAGNILGHSVFFMSPLYPYFLALLYSIFGYNLLLPRIFQIILGTTIPVLTYLIGMRFFDKKVASIAAFLSAFSGIMIFDEANLLLDHPLLTFLLLLSILLVLLSKENQKTLLWILSGICWGFTALGRASMLILIPLIVLWLYYATTPKLLKSILLFMAGIFLVILPITLHNYAIGKDFVLITSNGGLNFYIGNNQKATGMYQLPEGLNFMNDPSGAKLVEQKTGRQMLKPSEVSSYWFSQSMNYLTSKPLSFVFLLSRKWMLYWNWIEMPQLANNYYFIKSHYKTILKWPLVSFAIVCPLALTGLVLAFNDRKKLLLLYLLIAGLILSIILFFVTSRYRVPTQPLLMLFAAFTISTLYRYISLKKYKHIIPVVGLILMFVVVEKSLNFVYKLNFYRDYVTLGTIYMQEKEYHKALHSFQTAEQLASVDQPYYYERALADLKQKRYFSAFQAYRHSIQQIINKGDVYISLGDAYFQLKQYEKSIQSYQKALEFNTNVIAVYNRLGFAYISTNNLDAAQTILEKAVQLAPKYDKFHFNLGLVYLKKKMFQQARQEFMTTLKLNPRHKNAREYLDTLNEKGS